MTTVTPNSPAPPQHGTVADLLRGIGGVPPARVLMVPAPGTATEQDIFKVEARTGRLCELVDGVLVEKVMGSYESAVAAALIYFFKSYLRRHPHGVVLAPDGPLRILPRRIRLPDVAFVSRQRLGAHRLAKHRVLPVAPDLAVEVLSKGNTESEMKTKLHEYFEAGVRLVWYIDARTGTARSYTAPTQCETIPQHGRLTGGDVLPGFELSLRELFAEAEGNPEGIKE